MGRRIRWTMLLCVLLVGVSVAVSANELRISTPTQPTTLDPAFGIGMGEYMVNGLLYDKLVLLDASMELVPCIATSWEASDTADEWVFYLRQGVQFIDGSTLDAHDVVYTFERVLNPDVGSPGRGTLGPISRVIADDDYTVRFVLSVPYAEFPVHLALRWGGIVPVGAGESLSHTPLGSGPFVLKEWVVGSHIRVEANPGYWDPEVPGVNAIVVKFLPDAIAEIVAFETGELDIIAEVPGDLITRVRRIPGAQIEEVASGSWIPMIMRTDTPPFDDPRVRLAVKYAIDRQALVDIALGGRGIPANDHTIPPNNPYYLDVPIREQDYDMARQLLEDAGYPDGFEMELVASMDRPTRARVALAIQQMVAPLGIKLNVTTMSHDIYIAQVYRQGGAYIGWWGFRPTADGNLYPFFTCDGSWNEYVYCNDEFDAILDEARGELDPERRTALYHRAQEILMEDGPALIAAYTSWVGAWHPHVKNFAVHPLTWFDHLRWVAIEN